MLEELAITEPVIADALSARVGPRYLSAYFATARSMSEAVDYLEEPMGKVHYWTRRWHDLGLLEIVDRVQRAGRPIVRYRTIARKFVVPERLLPESLLERQLNAVNAAMLRNLQRGYPDVAYDGELTVWQPPGQRGISIDRASSRGKRAAEKGGLHSSFIVNLDPAETAELRTELEVLRDRWLERAGGEDRRAGEDGRRANMVILALAEHTAD
ncbi:hypothetical protein [Calidifontibacter terrae]